MQCGHAGQRRVLISHQDYHPSILALKITVSRAEQWAAFATQSLRVPLMQVDISRPSPRRARTVSVPWQIRALSRV